ncbi:MAG: rubrerythrin family protein [Clostridia bacterium]|nr:rubrerythrin family protein [Clostridia bacterium]
MSTEKNLKDAFAGESMANRKYLAFAKKAEQEGYLNAAKLFRAAAEAETIHAHNHLKALGGIKSTAENLKEGITGETYEFESMYPPMLEEAKKEGRSDAQRSFHLANEAEKVHAKLYQDALDNLENKEEVNYYLCPVCGYIEKNSTPEKCPICGAKGEVFVKY